MYKAHELPRNLLHFCFLKKSTRRSIKTKVPGGQRALASLPRDLQVVFFLKKNYWPIKKKEHQEASEPWHPCPGI